MMKALSGIIGRLRSDTTGSVVVETALVAPVLVVLGLGTYDISRIIARQSELQAGSTDVEGIVLAVSASTATNVSTIKQVLQNSLNLTSDKVTVTKVYRCNTSDTLTTSNASCGGTSDVLSTYVQVTITDTYTPVWSKFGIGSPFSYSLTKTVQVS